MKLFVAALLASAVQAFAPTAFVSNAVTTRTTATSKSSLQMAAAEELYIDQDRRNLMNLILLGSAGATVGALGIPYILFFLPPGAGGGGGGVSAKNALGDDLFSKPYLSEKKAGDRSLAQGLKGDATYLIVKDDNTLEEYGLNAVCTHLGCVVPWSAPNNKFMCPCHGSQYAPTGAVVRGPAPLPLALAHCNVAEDDKILFSPWTETDFRTGGKGWWN
mmetsp:Transcript_39506/g.92317  ORF Transcript_39506/g.92317 Transcript_39506/m.92317 type:complete len:218 (+) Transcript_39506:129-782(+)